MPWLTSLIAFPLSSCPPQRDGYQLTGGMSTFQQCAKLGGKKCVHNVFGLARWCWDTWEPSTDPNASRLYQRAAVPAKIVEMMARNKGAPVYGDCYTPISQKPRKTWHSFDHGSTLPSLSTFIQQPFPALHYGPKLVPVIEEQKNRAYIA